MDIKKKFEKILFIKIEVWIVFLLILLFFLMTIIFAAVIRHNYLADEKNHRFPKFQKNLVFLAEIPSNIKNFVSGREFSKKNLHLKKFERFKFVKRDLLLILPRFDYDTNKYVVDIFDIDNFKNIYTYYIDFNKIEKIYNPNVAKKPVGKNHIHTINHPLITEEGHISLISSKGMFFTLNHCSELVNYNNQNFYHHSLEEDMDGNFFVGSRIYPRSEIVKDRFSNYVEDAIAKINKKGQLIYNKSIPNILNYNSLWNYKYFNSQDSIHLNDIQPANFDSEYWNKGDLFLSLREVSTILQYRPSNNRIIRVIEGPFYKQHDIDIISNHEIAIFNNNNSSLRDNNISQILVYNFINKKFKKKFQHQLIKDNFKTRTQGLQEILNDGAMLVEETDHGRIIFFDKDGNKEWEYVNKSKNGKIYEVLWSRLISDKKQVKKLKKIFKTKKCNIKF